MGSFRQHMEEIPFINDLILPEDKEVINIIFEFKGIIYGGYLRDIISNWCNTSHNNIPVDIDAVFWSDMERSFIRKMRRSGYSLSNSDHGCFVLNKIGARPIEFYSIKNHKDGSCLKPEIFPDFIVNTLMFDGKTLQSWNSVVDDKSISLAINHIRDKKAGILDADHLRKKKILSKGYTLN